ncbi:hypothetical protein GYMLUDRAFT_157779, partial [Collybiopsis luxurians FD-317 M1]
WTHDDTVKFIDYLTDHYAEIGDGTNFKAKTFHGAAEVLELSWTAGGEKDMEACNKNCNW